MNIGFDAKRAFFNQSGLGNYSRSTINLLSRFYPHNKYLLFSAKDNREIFQLSNNQSIIESDTEIYKAIPALWRSWGIHRQINNLKPDIFHGLSNELPWSIKKTGVKAVVTIHDLIFLRYPEYYPFIDRKIYLQKFRFACQAADKIIATSNATKDEICHFFGTDPSKIEVVYQTCNPSFYTLLPESKKEEVRKKYNLPGNYLLFLGTIEKRKNVLSLIKAYLNKNFHIPLLIAGKATDYMDDIQQYINQHPGKSKILFRHNIETVDLPALYQAATVFVYPSVIEGFGIPILEALFSGVPVITSTGSCFSETGGNSAIYCDPLDIEQLGDTLSLVLNSHETREQMIEKGWIHSKMFSESIVASNLMKVYTQLA